MSTLNVANITDGTDTVGTSYVVNGSAKAWGACYATGVARAVGSFNVSSITDAGTNGKDFNLTSAFSAAPVASLGTLHIARWGNNQGFIIDGSAGITAAIVSVRYYDGTAYVDSDGSFLAHGDLA